jgi:hypothetical protein
LLRRDDEGDPIPSEPGAYDKSEQTLEDIFPKDGAIQFEDLQIIEKIGQVISHLSSLWFICM